MLQKIKLKYEKKERQAQDQPLEEHVKVPLCAITYDNIDQAEYCGKRCNSQELASNKQAVKHKRFGGTKKLDFEQPSSKLRRKNSAGAAVQVHRDRVVQLIGQKERHNKVSTSRGPKDRRVRLSAHTAIQFYDVQDRLGYEQPSKVIDWLIQKAKAAIEALEKLPSENHESVDTNNSVTQTKQEVSEERIYQLQQCQGSDMESQLSLNETTMNNENSFLTAAGTSSCSSQFQDYLTEKSLQSSKATDFDLHHSSTPTDFAEEDLNSVTILSDLNSTETGRFQSLMSWNSFAGNGGEEFFFNSLPSLLQQPLLCENQFFSQRGPLQSSNLFSFHASTNPPISVNGHALTQSPKSHLFSIKGLSSGGFVGI